MYLFAITDDGYYVLESYQGDSLHQSNFKILAGATSSTINISPQQPNLLTVIAQGSSIYLYVNAQFLTSVSNQTSSYGSIGVFAENTKGGPVDVKFNLIQVWTL